MYSRDTLFKTESDEIHVDTRFKTKHPENHALSGRTSPLRSHKGVSPGLDHTENYDPSLTRHHIHIRTVQMVSVSKRKVKT